MKKITLLCSLLLSTQFSYAQAPEDLNTITTAVPFLLINPHGQSMGIADIGVVASSEYYETGFTQNPALLSRNKKVMGGKNSYKPWLLHLVPDIRMFDANFYFSPSKTITLGFSYNHFSLGDIIFTDVNGTVTGQARPLESYYNLRYAQSLNPNLSLGLGLKYVVSDLTNGMNINGSPTYKGKAIAGDIGLDYRKEIAKTETSFWRYDLGVSILNIGNKMRYTDTGPADFLPMQLSLGALFTYTKNMGDDLKYCIDLAYQCDKLLAPTPPVYQHKYNDTTGVDEGVAYDSNGKPIVLEGRDPNRSVANAMITSFYDAPDGAKEEFAEILHKVGIENRMLINDLSYVACRFGYLYENINKGNRNYITMGLGGKYKFIYLDFGMILFYKDFDYQTERERYFLALKRRYSWNITLGFKYDFK